MAARPYNFYQFHTHTQKSFHWLIAFGHLVFFPTTADSIKLPYKAAIEPLHKVAKAKKKKSEKKSSGFFFCGAQIRLFSKSDLIGFIQPILFARQPVLITVTIEGGGELNGFSIFSSQGPELAGKQGRPTTRVVCSLGAEIAPNCSHFGGKFFSTSRTKLCKFGSRRHSIKWVGREKKGADG